MIILFIFAPAFSIHMKWRLHRRILISHYHQVTDFRILLIMNHHGLNLQKLLTRNYGKTDTIHLNQESKL